MVKWKENWKLRIINFDGRWRPGRLYWGWDVSRPKYFTIYYTRSLQGNMRICQGNLRNSQGIKCARVWEPCWRSLSYSSIGARTVWPALQLVSHIYSIKPACCQNNPAKYLLWMRLHQFQYLSIIKVGRSRNNLFITGNLLIRRHLYIS